MDARNMPSKDFRTEHGGVLNPVLDQKRCHMCWAIVAAEAVSAIYNLKYGFQPLMNLSCQELLDFCKPDEAECYTYSINRAFDYIMEKGIQHERDYPFKGTNQKLTAEERKSRDDLLEDRFVKINGYERLDANDEPAMIERASIQPVACAVNLTKEFQNTGWDVYEGPEVEPKKKNLHAILIAGYDTDENSGKNYWLIKNSHGTTWGKEGYGRIARKSSMPFGRANPICRASFPFI